MTEKIDWSRVQAKKISNERPDGWPEGVRAISQDGLTLFGVEEGTGELFWDGKRVETRTRLSLTRPQRRYAGAIMAATVVAALGAAVQGWAAYNDWACKVGWWAVC